MLDQQLGIAVGICRLQPGIFFYWNGFRLAIDSGGRREDQPSWAVSEHRFKQRQRGSCVVAEKLLRMEHGLAGFDEGGKVENAVKGPSLLLSRGKNVLKRRPVCQLSLNELHAHRQQVAVAMAKVVKNDGLMPIRNQQASNSTTYIPRTACYQNLHMEAVPFRETLV